MRKTIAILVGLVCWMMLASFRPCLCSAMASVGVEPSPSVCTFSMALSKRFSEMPVVEEPTALAFQTGLVAAVTEA